MSRNVHITAETQELLEESPTLALAPATLALSRLGGGARCARVASP